jgi:hypothetical protein
MRDCHIGLHQPRVAAGLFINEVAVLLHRHRVYQVSSPGTGPLQLRRKRDGGGRDGAIKAFSGRPDMHATTTLHYAVVLSGEVTLILDRGEVTLKPFDTVVQPGTAQTWENRGSKPALIAFVLLDAKPLPHP